MKYKLEKVKSTNIVAIGYEKEQKTLYILFGNGMYKYNPIEEELYTKFSKAESIGKYFNSVIRPGKEWKCEKINFKPEELDFNKEETKHG